MDKLKSQNGYVITETIVGVIILGLVLSLFVLFFNQIFSNPKILLRNEALYLADQEIELSVNNKVTKDTSYTNKRGNLLVTRSVIVAEKTNKVTVSVIAKSNKQNILSLSALYRSEIKEEESFE